MRLVAHFGGLHVAVMGVDVWVSDVIREGHHLKILFVIFGILFHKQRLSPRTDRAQPPPPTSTSISTIAVPVESSLFSQPEYYDNFCETASKVNHNLVPCARDMEAGWSIIPTPSAVWLRTEQTNAEQDKSA